MKPLFFSFYIFFFFRFKAQLHFHSILAILLDFRRTQDWFYAMRWVPHQEMVKILRAAPFTFKQEYAYLAHKKLFPFPPISGGHGYTTREGQMNPQEYRAKYSELVALAPDSDEKQSPDKYLQKVKEYHNIK